MQPYKIHVAGVPLFDQLLSESVHLAMTRPTFIRSSAVAHFVSKLCGAKPC